MTAKVTPAKGTKGCLIWIGGDKYMFRVYAEDKTFKDYDLRHCDMDIEIVDPSAAFWEYEDGEMFVDYTKEALGVANGKD